MRRRRTARLASVLMLTVLALAACGGNDGGEGSDDGAPQLTASPAGPPTESDDSQTPTDPTAATSSAPPTSRTSAPDPSGTVITTGDSEFGEMLFDSRTQAIYLFEPEADGTPACYDDCAEAWPPVLTKGAPQAEGNLDPALLGTVQREDGATQVTYNDWPLYFYAHEGPGQVLCHDVVLNGGLWLVLGPDGKARPS